MVLAASYEAKAFGVRGGMSGRKARELCPQLIFVGGHFSDYQRLGDAAIAVLGDFTPLVERISIDEAFADVAGCTHLFGSPAEIAAAIRRRVRAELGLPISVGVARTKHLAKIASQVAKPDGLVVVDPATELEFLHDLPVELMWGVGPVTRAKLADQGILTIGQLADDAGRARSNACSATPPARSSRALAWNRDPRGIRHAASGAIGRRAVGARAAAGDRGGVHAGAASPRRPGRLAAPRQGARRPDRHRARSLRRHARRDPVGDARRADLGDDDARRDRRGPGARRARRPSARDGSSRCSRSRSPISRRQSELQLELPLGLPDEKRRPGTRQGAARWSADRAMDAIRERFGRDAIGYAAVALDRRRSVPDAFRELAEKDLGKHEG